MTLITNERDAYKTQLDEATSILSKQESEKASLFSEEAEALRKSISRRDEEVRGSPQKYPGPLHSTTLTVGINLFYSYHYISSKLQPRIAKITCCNYIATSFMHLHKFNPVTYFLKPLQLHL